MKLDELNQKELDEFRQHLLSYITNVYSLAGKFPDEEKLLKKFLISSQELRQYIAQEDFQNALKSRGIPSFNYDKKSNPVLNLSEEDLDPLFVAVANVMTNPSDTRSDNAKLKQFEPVGVTKEVWTGWLTQPHLAKYVVELVNKRFDVQADLAAKAGLMRRLKEADLNAIKYHNEITGKYRPLDTNSQTMAIMMAMLMEILTRHLPQGKVDAIAEELEMLNLPKPELLEGKIVK